MRTLPAGTIRLRARWVIPVTSPPRENAAVTVCGGRICALDAEPGASTEIDLGDVALLPAFVNAHTHLEFSELPSPLTSPGQSFSSWILAVVEQRRRQSRATEGADLDANRDRAIRTGLEESVRRGVGVMGEISVSPRPMPVVPGTRGVQFLELLGLGKERTTSHLARSSAFLASTPGQEWNIGLSPHAPYTVEPELVRRVCEMSALGNFPVAMHLGETLEELELLGSHSGGLVEALRSLDAWNPSAIPRGIRPRDYLELLSKAARSLVIHGNYLADDDWSILADHPRMSVVYCPRTFTFFHPGEYPLARMLAAGVRVAVGTDSRASNPDLCVLSELRHIARLHPEIRGSTILELGTLRSAEALGVNDLYGSLDVAKAACFAVVPLDVPNNDDPLEALLDCDNQASLVIGR